MISDNASSNDSCLVNFYRDRDAEMGSADVQVKCMRCYGHILNLVARAFLHGEGFEAFETESQVCDLLGRRKDDIRHWRKKGSVGKIHNVAKFIKSSPQRCELFTRISRENDEEQEYHPGEKVDGRARGRHEQRNEMELHLSHNLSSARQAGRHQGVLGLSRGGEMAKQGGHVEGGLLETFGRNQIYPEAILPANYENAGLGQRRM
ncbi:hypothetical protein FOMA001_g19773 [Fusarium oxysporum f. sp. matthiolae]|nr:hypothetical protein FOMA001_g19773 [Fusarium oxysporum f. sp. matthiolae]